MRETLWLRLVEFADPIAAIPLVDLGRQFIDGKVALAYI